MIRKDEKAKNIVMFAVAERAKGEKVYFKYKEHANALYTDLFDYL